MPTKCQKKPIRIGFGGSGREADVSATTEGKIDSSTIETERLRLTPFVPGDAEPLRRLTDDPAIVDAVSFLRAPFTLADAAALIARNGNGQDLFRGLWRRADDLLIGVVGSHLQGTGAVEIGYWIGTAFQRQGYAREAASAVIERLRTATPPPRIVAECRPENRASWRVLERLGFRPTGAPGARPGRVELVLPT
jgi:RimJ/RimL family protein N-acetyltransferase